MARFVFEKVFQRCFLTSCVLLLFGYFTNSVAGQANIDPPAAAPVRPNVVAPGVNRAVSRGGSTKLADDPACQNDVRKFCKGSTTSNMQVLDCLQNNEHDEEISTACQHVLYQYKYNLTHDLKFESAAGEICRNSLSKIPECSEEDRGQGLIIPCLIEYIDNITDVGCKNFLARMESVVFSDYRLVHNLARACQTDINELHCGRLEDQEVPEGGGQPAAPHGDTISCLMEKATNLQASCKLQILRLAELQADDFNKDRQLFLACRQDRERLCSKVQAGQGGQVYKCLFQHKFDEDMSDECKKRLTVRQKLQREDFKVNRGLAVSCRTDIVVNNCLKTNGSQPGELKEARLSAVLLCLEHVSNMGKRKLTPECVAELKEVRRSLMSDYQLSPEIMSNCAEEIKSCSVGGSVLRNGKTLHCLMDLARKNVHTLVRGGARELTTFNVQCRLAMGVLMKEVNIRQNVNVDPVLQEACSNVINSKCSDIPVNKVVDCLMNIVSNTKIMTEDCKEKLMELQYFVSRDFRLSVKFYRSCETDIKECRADLNIISSPGKTLSTADQSKILLCVFRKNNDKKSQADKECLREAKKVMIDRANSVDLAADVEDVCMSELGQYCSDKTEKDEEMNCLEDHLEKLSEECKEVIERYVEEEDEEPELHEVFRVECEPVIKKHCQEAADKGRDEDDNTLMECLIKHKRVDEMNKKCLSQVNHHQIISITDYKLSHAFKEACKSSVLEHCPRIKNKAEVVTCLSELVRNDTYAGKEPRVDRKCRKQLTFELLQRGENIDMDPDLKAACLQDVNTLCSQVFDGRNSILSCLRNHQGELKTPGCHAFIFKREIQEANDPRTDFMLMTKCKKMIKKHCADNMRDPATIFTCLVKKKELEDFDKECTRVIIVRERLRSKDIRLNPGLMKDCGTDVQKFCNQFLNIESPTEAEGKVLYCLRMAFARQNQFKAKISVSLRLSDTCYTLVRDMIKESVLDHLQDRRLVTACNAEISGHCLDAMNADKNELGDRGEVIECLRRAIANHTITNTKCLTEITRVMSEEMADVQVDPLLYRACAVDIQVNCKDVPRGEGRHMSCLLDLQSDRSITLRPECAKALTSRVKLWELAVKIAPPESIAEFAHLLNDSSARNYLLVVILCVLGMIFLGGLCCGRVTKRVAQQIKNR